jgi:hypothetical protein
MGKTFSTGLLTDGISQDSSNNIGIGVAPSGTNKFEVSGSTKLNGNTAITGSLTVSSSANAIILPAGQTIGLGTAQIYTGTGGNSGNIFIQGAQTKLYADKVVLEAATAAGVEVIGGTKLSGSFIVSGSATTIGTTVLSGSLTVSGSITSTSTITAQTLVVQTITSSVLYSSGSNIFGNALSNTQVMTGSVGITGSLTLNNIAIPTSASLASTYLPLTGGTLTGALGGTSAIFSSTIQGTIITATSYFKSDTYRDSRAETLISYQGSNNIRLGSGVGSDYLTFLAGGTLKATLDASGNLGLGVTPSAWATVVAAQVLNAGFYGYSTNVGGIAVNTYYSTGWKYITSSTVSTRYELSNGSHIFYSGAGGTAGTAATESTLLTIASTGAATFSSSVTAGGKFEASFSNTNTSFDNNSYLRLVNTGASTLNQRVDLIMRWADGTYNGTGGISMVRESATARSGKLIFQPIGSDGNNLEALTIASTGAANFTNSLRIQGSTVPTSGSGTELSWDGTNGYLLAFNRSTSAYLPLSILGSSLSFTGVATFSNNVGISAAPNTWSSSFKVLQIGTAAVSTNSPAYGYLSANFYADAAGADRYIGSGKAGVIAISNGEILFYNTNTSGTADAALTTTERMRITSGGNVGINQTSPSTQFQIRKNYWQFWNEKAHDSSANLFSITLPDFGAAVVTIAGSRYSPGADNYSGTSTFYIYVNNVGAVSVNGGSNFGSFTPTTSVSSKTVTFASAYAGSATNYTGASIEIIASGHSGGGESAITVAVL